MYKMTEVNRERLLQIKKQYRIRNKNRLNEKQRTKIQCDCGAYYSYSNKARHNKSKKHLNYLSTK